MSETPIREAQDAEREDKRTKCEHRWEYCEVGGVIVGLSRCVKCGTTSRTTDFLRGKP
jgi:hypothetical protein